MNYKKLFSAFLLLSVFFIMSFSYMSVNNSPVGEVKVMITTDFGVIKLKLYDETPVHRDNFVKLIKWNYFDSLLFHRVIQNFMIQGGDPDSKNAPPVIELGNGGPGYTIRAEFNSKLFHKKGVIAAARDSDLENPGQASAGSQFYIVQGRVFNDSLLKIQADRITKLKLFNTIVNRIENKSIIENYQRFVKDKQADSTKYLNDIITKQVEKEFPDTKPHTFTDEQTKAYTTIGGTPHLDMSYTIFGEVYEGIEVIDSIAKQKVDKNNRPFTDVRMKIAIIQ